MKVLTRRGDEDKRCVISGVGIGGEEGSTAAGRRADLEYRGMCCCAWLFTYAD